MKGVGCVTSDGKYQRQSSSDQERGALHWGQLEPGDVESDRSLHLTLLEGSYGRGESGGRVNCGQDIMYERINTKKR